MEADTIYEVDLNDSRLTNRFNLIVNQFNQNLSGSIVESSQTKKAMKATYRFFHNKKVLPEKLIAGSLGKHLADSECLVEDDSLPRRYLALSDGSDLDYKKKRSGQKKTVGILRGKRRGLKLHNTMLISDLGVPIGLLKQDYISRKDEDIGKKDRRKIPIEERESMKWLNHLQAAQDFSVKEEVEVVFVADREADIMDLYVSREKTSSFHILVRAQHNRCTVNKNEKLYDLLGKQPTLERYNIDLTDAVTLKKRTALVGVRATQVEIKLQETTSRKTACKGKVEKINAIEIYEIDPPAHIKEPVRWVLLTTLPIDTLEQIRIIIRYYILRWLIERFHFLLKTGGANVEELQLEKLHTLKNAITTYSIATLEVFKMRYLAQFQGEKNVFEVGIEQEDCEILYKYAQQKVDSKLTFDKYDPPTVWEFCRVLAMCVGFIPSKRQPLPGLKILTKAFKKFYLLKDFYQVFHNTT